MKKFGIIGALVAVLAVGFVFYVFSGFYHIGATTPHRKVTRWLINAAVESSIRRHAKGIEAPPLADPSFVEEGFLHYRAMCAGCHGAPGVRPSEMGEGLYPKAPDLTEAAAEWTPSELYWITKEGIKMTGMPAWGPTHSDWELWAMVAFVKRLPSMGPEDYLKMVEAADKKAMPGGEGYHEEHEHSHDHSHDH